MANSGHVETFSSREPKRSCGTLWTGRLDLSTFRGRSLLIVCLCALFFLLGRFAGAVQNGEKVLRADAIRAEKYELLGPHGKTAASFQTKAGGEVSLSFYGADGSSRMDIGISQNGEPSLRLYDAKARPKLTLLVSTKDEAPRIMLSSGQLINTSIILAIDEAGPRMSILDSSIVATNDASVSMGLNARGEPNVFLRGKKNKPSITLTTSANGPSISMTETDGGGGLHDLNMSLNDRGEPTIRVGGKVNEPGVALSVDTDGPSIRISGKGEESGVVLSVGKRGPSIRMGKEGFGGPYTEWRPLPDGSPAVFISDDNGTLRFIVTIGKDGTPAVRSLRNN